MKERKFLSWACRYFIWDTIDAIVNFMDVGFVVHGLACWPSISGRLYAGQFVFVVSPLLNFVCRSPFLVYYAVSSLGSVCRSINLLPFSFVPFPLQEHVLPQHPLVPRQDQPYREQLPAYQRLVPPRHVLRSEARLWRDVCRTCFTRGFFLALGPYSRLALVISIRAYAIPSPASSAVSLYLYLWRRECRVAGSELVLVRGTFFFFWMIEAIRKRFFGDTTVKTHTSNGTAPK